MYIDISKFAGARSKEKRGGLRECAGWSGADKQQVLRFAQDDNILRGIGRGEIA